VACLEGTTVIAIELERFHYFMLVTSFVLLLFPTASLVPPFVSSKLLSFQFPSSLLPLEEPITPSSSFFLQQLFCPPLPSLAVN
jgi:hypothetical protein